MARRTLPFLLLLTCAVAAVPGPAMAQSSSSKFKQRSAMSSGLLKPEGKSFAAKTRNTASKSTFIRSNAASSGENFKLGVRDTARTKFAPTKDNSSGGSGTARAAQAASGFSVARTSGRQGWRRPVDGDVVDGLPPVAKGAIPVVSGGEIYYRHGGTTFRELREARNEGTAHPAGKRRVTDARSAAPKGAIPIVAGGTTSYRYGGIDVRAVGRNSTTR